MNPFQFPVTCDTCGGDGLGDIKTAAAGWDANSVVRHRDPAACHAVLERKRVELEKTS